ncbi:MAG: anaerobic ribonucleoside-triphosphate reductase activating protein [Candidatus Theseobacter exili]|nr:anaerobic ribonucleoside-triphosphate reductase activating protein [Candidatus Theseobacter exili]
MQFRLKGIQKTTLLDFPGRVSATVFTGGCNFRCPYCHNISLVEGHQNLPDLPLDEVLAFFVSRKCWLDGIVISGGEPTLADGIIDFSRSIKDIGLDVKWDTNGSHPDIIEQGLDEKVVDYIAMDIKSSPSDYKRAAGVNVDLNLIRRSIELLKEKCPEYEFRTTVVPALHNEDTIMEIVGFIGGGKKFSLQQFHQISTLDSSFQEQKAFSRNVLEIFQGKISQYFDKCDIRN